MYAIVGVCGVGAVLCLQIIAELEKRVASLQNLVQELRARLMGAGGDVSGCVGLDSMAVVSEDTVAIGSVRVDTNDGDSDGDGGVATGKEDEEDDDNPVREHTTHGETRVWPDGVRFGVVWVVGGIMLLTLRTLCEAVWYRVGIGVCLLVSSVRDDGVQVVAAGVRGPRCHAPEHSRGPGTAGVCPRNGANVDGHCQFGATG